jgi:3-oxoacyl-[acyl-carrier-protein] synthase-3
MGAVISGWGKALPPAVLTNDALAEFLDTSDEWVRTRTGIRERRISHVGVVELATVAAQHALAAAGVGPDEVDCLMLATASPDLLVPNSASRVQAIARPQRPTSTSAVAVSSMHSPRLTGSLPLACTGGCW